MKIICPACSFTRDVDEGKLPPAAAIATCPRCKERFRFREPAAADWNESPMRLSSAPETGERPASDDGAPPPGAVIPPHTHGLLDEDLFSQSRDNTPPHSPSASQGEEDEQESRRQAAEAYRRMAELPPLPGMQELSNPWEDPREGYPAAFYQTAVRVLFAAPRFFAGLAPQKRLARALFFYLIVGLIQTFAEQFWLAILAKVLAPRAESDPQLAYVFTVLSREMSLPLFVLVRTALISLELFLASMLYHIMFRIIAPAEANFSLIFQIIAYASAPALLGVIPLVGSLAGFVWSIACSIIGCRYALRISWMKTVLALGPLYLVIFLLFLQASIAARGM
ncbi:MAG: zinc-ribbon domain-containing protein [Betaproteobacteria bacterium]|nr:zinc-ribbon domain-containing protein [Betaproteobacteria bacterium]